MFRTLDDIGDVRGKRVLVRADLNVPMDGARVSDDSRLRAAMPTIAELADKGARVVVLSHFGRPKRGPDPSLSLRAVADALYVPVWATPVWMVSVPPFVDQGVVAVVPFSASPLPARLTVAEATHAVALQNPALQWASVEHAVRQAAPLHW